MGHETLPDARRAPRHRRSGRHGDHDEQRQPPPHRQRHRCRPDRDSPGHQLDCGLHGQLVPHHLQGAKWLHCQEPRAPADEHHQSEHPCPTGPAGGRVLCELHRSESRWGCADHARRAGVPVQARPGQRRRRLRVDLSTLEKAPRGRLDFFNINRYSAEVKVMQWLPGKALHGLCVSSAVAPDFRKK